VSYRGGMWSIALLGFTMHAQRGSGNWLSVSRETDVIPAYMVSLGGSGQGREWNVDEITMQIREGRDVYMIPEFDRIISSTKQILIFSLPRTYARGQACIFVLREGFWKLSITLWGKVA